MNNDIRNYPHETTKAVYVKPSTEVCEMEIEGTIMDASGNTQTLEESDDTTW